MSSRNLEYLFSPRSVALVGASDQPHSVGATVMQNLLTGGFGGPIWAVNRRHAMVAGHPAFASIASLPDTPDLAVLCTPAETIPGLIADLGRRGTRAAVVLSAGLDAPAAGGGTLNSAMLDAARPYGLRILGPNCVGLLMPPLGLNASFAHTQAHTGHLAFVSQSGALTTAMLDWAGSAGIGFSIFVSLGNGADVDFGDVLDVLALDPETHAILLYVESITSARKFMSAARAVARHKPVIVVKAGRRLEGAKAAASHTGALAGADEVYDAAFRRAGLLRVGTTRELFEAAETLSRLKALPTGRLSIVSNGGGPGVMATDALIEGGGELAHLSPATLASLDACLPTNWSHANPIDIVGDAPADRYVTALSSVLADPDTGAVLFIHAPTAIVSPGDIARGCLPLLMDAQRPVLTCWMGGEGVSEARRLCESAGLPTYSTPEEAVNAFLQARNYQQNQQQLLEVPSSYPESFTPDRNGARAIISQALAERRSQLTETEAKGVLAAYRIPVVPTHPVTSVDEACTVAAALGYPVAIKIDSPDITHKSDLGGVALDLGDEGAVRDAATAMLASIHIRVPQAQIRGFTVQPMIRRSHAQELIAGVTFDRTFGPVILFGHGGVAVEVLDDKAIGLPPLNTALARDLISRTRVSRLLQGYRNRPPADQRAIDLVLVQLSQMVVDLPEVQELDINPLLADEQGVLALDARIRIAPAAAGVGRLAIRPYPAELEERLEFLGRPLRLRPIRPEDTPQHRDFLARVTPEDLRARFFAAVSVFPETQLRWLTQIDYERAMAFIAEARTADGRYETLGVVRAHAHPDNLRAEFGLLVRSDLKARGLGTLLLNKMIRYCRDRGIARLEGEVLADNITMLKLTAACGFAQQPARYGVVQVSLDLTAAAAA